MESGGAQLIHADTQLPGLYEKGPRDQVLGRGPGARSQIAAFSSFNLALSI